MNTLWLDNVVSWLLTYTLHSTLLLITAWLVSRLFTKGRPALEDGLWKGAMVGAPVSATLAFVFGQESAWRWALPQAAAAAPSMAAPSTAAASMTVPASSEVVAFTAPSMAPAPLLGDSGLGWIALVWAGMATLFVVSLAVSGARLRRQLADRCPVTEGPLVAVLDRLRRSASYGWPVRLTVSEHLRIPAALGFRRPEICLPERALRELSAAELEGVLGHELAHLVRNDPAWRLLARLVEGIFFFQPLQRLAARRLRRLSEYLCDDWTVERTGGGVSLARCLAAVADWTLEARLFPLASMTEGGSELEGRVRRLLDGAPKRASGLRGRASRRAFTLVLAAFVVAAGFLTPSFSAAPAGQDPPGEESEQEEETREQEEAERVEQMEKAREQMGEQAAAAREQMEKAREQMEKARKQMGEQAAAVREQMEKAREQMEKARKQMGEQAAAVREQMEKAHEQMEKAREQIGQQAAAAREQMEKAREQMEKAREQAAAAREQAEVAREQAAAARQQAAEARKRAEKEKQQEEDG